MELQALHGLAKKLLGVPSIREEVLKVLNEDETFQDLQNDMAGQQSTHNRASGLRRRLPTSRVVRSSGDGAGQDDPHADTWTEPSIGPDSPRINPDMLKDTLDLNSEWDGSEFELLSAPDSSESGDPLLAQPGESGKGSIGHRVAQWLQKCAQNIAKVVGGVCQGAVTLAKGLVRDCTQLMTQVSSWCQRTIDGIRRRVASMPRWAKVASGVVVVAVLMGAIVMLLMPPPPPFLP